MVEANNTIVYTDTNVTQTWLKQIIQLECLTSETPKSPMFFLFSFNIMFNYIMHVEGLLPTNLCLVTLLSAEQCSQFPPAAR